MTQKLDAIVQGVRAARGVAHKRDIAPVLARLRAGAPSAIRNGDDCAAIPDGDGFLLFAIEGFLPDFVAAEPRFSGWCGVMVNVSDIYAMGGRPIAVVDAVFADGAENAAPVLDGLAAASRAYGVPVVGGHTNTRAAGGGLSVAVLGRAARLLTSFDAKPGQVLIAAIDLRGGFRAPHIWWDCATGAPPERLRADLELLPALAEAGLCAAAKDISMAGVLGTALMLLECSGIGARIELDAIPRPEGVALEQWLPAFPSYGFLLAADPPHARTVIARFADRGIAAAAIGTCDASRIVRVAQGAAEMEIWRFADAVLIGAAA
jgi:AIR synthase-related protein